MVLGSLRKYGGCPHAGFGLGFERLNQYVTGMANIRDVIPFEGFSRYCSKDKVCNLGAVTINYQQIVDDSENIIYSPALYVEFVV